MIIAIFRKVVLAETNKEPYNGEKLESSYKSVMVQTPEI